MQLTMVESLPTTPSKSIVIGVYGSGAIGSFFGILLSLCPSISRVLLLGRSSLLNAYNNSKLSVKSYNSSSVIQPNKEKLVVITDANDLISCNIILVCVKSKDTVDCGRLLRELFQESNEPLIISMQNGLQNPSRLLTTGLRYVLTSVVGFNVIWTTLPNQGDSILFEQTTSKNLSLELLLNDHKQFHIYNIFTSAFRESSYLPPLTLTAEIGSVAQGKLLINLGNGICAATGLTIYDFLSDANGRKVYRAAIEEGLLIMKQRQMSPILPPLFLSLLSLPSWIAAPILRYFSGVNKSAKFSTLLDMEAGKPIEIDDLNGEIVHLALTRTPPAPKGAPVNSIIIKYVKQVNVSGFPRKFINICEIRDEIEAVTTVASSDDVASTPSYQCAS